MNRYPEHHPHIPNEPVVASLCDDEFFGRATLRQVLSRLGLRANESQENILLELIYRSKSRKQHQTM